MRDINGDYLTVILVRAYTYEFSSEPIIENLANKLNSYKAFVEYADRIIYAFPSFSA